MGEMILQAVKVGRMADAEEWALRSGIAIARKHLPNGTFEEQDALAVEIAENLTLTRRIFERVAP